MSQYALLIAFIFFGIAIACGAWRLLSGPLMEDRILALDMLYVNATAVIILLGLVFATRVYFEVALVVALLGFIGTVVLAKYLIAGDITK
ncbi:MAG: K+/H+ antiporter subunit F [Gammaproteobacteria bacterium]|nr:K+/H+ antiporter subunit F [Gammaproteobacteria bacterium]